MGCKKVLYHLPVPPPRPISPHVLFTLPEAPSLVFFVKVRHPQPRAFAPVVSSARNSLPSDISRFTLQGPQVLLSCHLLRKTFLTSLSAVRECSLSALSHCPPAVSLWSPLYILWLFILFIFCTRQCQSWEGRDHTCFIADQPMFVK